MPRCFDHKLALENPHSKDGESAWKGDVSDSYLCAALHIWCGRPDKKDVFRLVGHVPSSSRRTESKLGLTSQKYKVPGRAGFPLTLSFTNPSPRAC